MEGESSEVEMIRFVFFCVSLRRGMDVLYLSITFFFFCLFVCLIFVSDLLFYPFLFLSDDGSDDCTQVAVVFPLPLFFCFFF